MNAYFDFFWRLYLQTLGWYAILTLPAFLIWPLYLVSLFIAVIAGLAAVPLFLFLYWAGKHTGISQHWAGLYLHICSALAVWASFIFILAILMILYGYSPDWEWYGQLSPVLLFPCAATAAAFISIQDAVKAWPFLPRSVSSGNSLEPQNNEYAEAPNGNNAFENQEPHQAA